MRGLQRTIIDLMLLIINLSKLYNVRMRWAETVNDNIVPDKNLIKQDLIC